jgi:hypothetical protein
VQSLLSPTLTRVYVCACVFKSVNVCLLPVYLRKSSSACVSYLSACVYAMFVWVSHSLTPSLSPAHSLSQSRLHALSLPPPTHSPTHKHNPTDSHAHAAGNNGNIIVAAARRLETVGELEAAAQKKNLAQPKVTYEKKQICSGTDVSESLSVTFSTSGKFAVKKSQKTALPKRR